MVVSDVNAWITEGPQITGWRAGSQLSLILNGFLFPVVLSFLGGEDSLIAIIRIGQGLKQHFVSVDPQCLCKAVEAKWLDK